MVHKDRIKHNLDKFYTKAEVVDFCLNQINLSNYELIVEPAAGSGAFSSKIPNCLAYDIAPESPDILQQDYLTYQYCGNVDRSKILVITNPPFGNNGSLVLKFMYKSAEFADTFALIVPRSFKKSSMQKRVPENYHLIQYWDLPENSFVLNGEPYNVPCIFGIWQNLYKPREKEIKIEPIGFKYVKPTLANCCFRRVGVNAGRAWLDVEGRSEQSHFFMLADEPDKLVNYLNSITWEHENTTGPRSVSKQELNKMSTKNHHH